MIQSRLKRKTEQFQHGTRYREGQRDGIITLTIPVHADTIQCGNNLISLFPHVYSFMFDKNSPALFFPSFSSMPTTVTRKKMRYDRYVRTVMFLLPHVPSIPINSLLEL